MTKLLGTMKMSEKTPPNVNYTELRKTVISLGL